MIAQTREVETTQPNAHSTFNYQYFQITFEYFISIDIINNSETAYP